RLWPRRVPEGRRKAQPIDRGHHQRRNRMSTWTRCDTIAVRTGIESDTQYGAVVPPIHLSSNYTFAEFGRPRRFDYSRSGNPTRAHLGAALADLEGGQAGVVTATGMAAITAVLQLLKPQD